MFFKSYNIYENKLSEKLSDDNPYKKKLIEMETPSEKHPIYTGLVWGLLIYSWIFFIVLLYKQINLSYLYNLKLVISSANIIFVTLAICLCYKKKLPHRNKSNISSQFIYHICTSRYIFHFNRSSRFWKCDKNRDY